MQTDSITFTSNIRFVNKKAYTRLISQKNSKYIDFTPYARNFVKSQDFFTEDIRTCSAGGITNLKNEAVGFHIYDCRKNIKNFDDIKYNLLYTIDSPQNGLLLGSKDLPDRKFSIELFARIKNVMKEQLENFSIFKKHQTAGESHITYSLGNDTWTICSTFVKMKGNKPQGFKDVSSIEDLKECFEKISIAKNDRLFINDKQVTSKDCPEFFEL